jgi:NAD(P)-dependent dehydrogenase (short-subunit alcohol dehydrogenase family)
MRDFDYRGLLDLSGRGYVVLGTGPGIGGEACNALAQCGAKLLCVDLSLEAAQATADVVGGHAMAADITKREDMEAVFSRARELFGAEFYGVVDVVGVPLMAMLDEADDALFDRQYDLVLRHAWLIISIAAPMLAENGGGSIVLIGSMGAHEYNPKVALYSAAKGALNTLARMSSVEYGPKGVRINVVSPGRVKESGVSRPTEEQWRQLEETRPLKRVGRPPEIASAILFMASDMSSYITGHVLMADGGNHNCAGLLVGL